MVQWAGPYSPTDAHSCQEVTSRPKNSLHLTLPSWALRFPGTPSLCWLGLRQGGYFWKNNISILSCFFLLSKAPWKHLSLLKHSVRKGDFYEVWTPDSKLNSIRGQVPISGRKWAKQTHPHNHVTGPMWGRLHIQSWWAWCPLNSQWPVSSHGLSLKWQYTSKPFLILAAMGLKIT